MGPAVALRVAFVTAALIGALIACSSAIPSPAGPARSTSPQLSAAQQHIQQAVDTFNAAADGPVARQQAALARLVDPGQRSVQRGCAAPTSTLTFEPVYARLEPAPGWTPATGTFSGTVYALPTLIRIHTGNRITGTDLTDLHISVDGGRAWFPALCLS